MMSKLNENIKATNVFKGNITVHYVHVNRTKQIDPGTLYFQ